MTHMHQLRIPITSCMCHSHSHFHLLSQSDDHYHCHYHSSISHNSFVETRITATRSTSNLGELVSKQHAAKVVQRSIRNPHLLLGWEIHVDRLGVGYVTGLRTSHFFSTRFRVQVIATVAGTVAATV